MNLFYIFLIILVIKSHEVTGMKLEVKKAVNKEVASAARGRRGGRSAGSGGRGQSWGGPNSNWGGMSTKLISKINFYINLIIFFYNINYYFQAIILEDMAVVVVVGLKVDLKVGVTFGVIKVIINAGNFTKI